MHPWTMVYLGIFLLLPCLSVLSVECSMLGHHIHHSHEDDNDSHIKAATARNSGLIESKVHGNFKLTILRGSGGSGVNRRHNGKGGGRSNRGRFKPKKGGGGNRRERRPKKIRDKRQRRPFPFRIPKTGFTCKGRAPGYYADVEADCQVYRMCMSRGTGGQAFLCPEGTKFNQRTLVCDHAAKVKCHQASSFFHRNLVIHEASLKASGGGRDNKVSGENNRNLQPKKQEIVKAKGPQIQQQKKVLSKRPRLEESPAPIIKLNVKSNVIKTQALNGKLRFAPLFETKRQKAFEKFAKALKFETTTETPSLFSGRLNKGKAKHGRGKSMNEQEHLLGLDGDLTGKIQGETEEELEPLEGQLLPPKAAGKAVARFRQDPEQPAAPALSLIPPPQQQPEQVIQLVGHVMSPHDLSQFPDSKIFQIKKTVQMPREFKSQEIVNPGRSSPPALHSEALSPAAEFVTKKSQFGSPARLQGGRSTKELPRSGRVIGLPVQLKTPGRGLPAPLVWISPGSLARSPMVSLRHLEADDGGGPSAPERALTMTFPGRPRNRFSRNCLECMSLMGTTAGSSHQCSMCLRI